MLTEVGTTLWAVRVQGRIVTTNLPSQRIAENALLNLPPEQQRLAEVIPVTPEGKTVLFG
jgi:hypothetical protein